jgi:hypothetical protein
MSDSEQVRELLALRDQYHGDVVCHFPPRAELRFGYLERVEDWLASPYTLPLSDPWMANKFICEGMEFTAPRQRSKPPSLPSPPPPVPVAIESAADRMRRVRGESKEPEGVSAKFFWR